MNQQEVFRQLTAGIVFNKEHNPPTIRNEAPIVRPAPIFDDSTETKTDKKRRKEKEEKPSSNENITLLKGLGQGNTDSEGKKNKNNKELVEKEKINHLRNLHKINISGSNNCPPPIESFCMLASRYNVSSILLKNINRCGYTLPTPIQMQAIPAMMEGHQILGCAPTGSGKTASFLIPVIHMLNKPKKDGIRAVVVSPTRELARQTFRECERLCHKIGLVVRIIARTKERAQNEAAVLSQKFDILMTTPNKLVHLLTQDPPLLNLSRVEWLVVDESDKLFETGVRGFRDQLAVIYRACSSENLKRAMFSATNTVEVAKWCRKNLKDLVSVTVGHRNTTVDSVEQELIYTGNEEGKLIAIRDLIAKGINPPVLVFLQSKERAKELCCELVYDGINVDTIHSDRTQSQRDKVVKSFREGKIWVLICTELMGRGIDFKGVNLVINYDFPTTAISYIHRIGRTGRAGKRGKAVTFFTNDDGPYLRSIANVMKESGCSVPEYLLKLKRPHKKIRRRLEGSAPVRQPIAEKPERYKKRKNNSTANKNDEEDNEKKGNVKSQAKRQKTK